MIAVVNYHSQAFEMLCNLLPEDLGILELSPNSRPARALNECTALFVPPEFYHLYTGFRGKVISFLPHAKSSREIVKMSRDSTLNIVGFMCYSLAAEGAVREARFPFFGYRKRYRISEDIDIDCLRKNGSSLLRVVQK